MHVCTTYVEWEQLGGGPYINMYARLSPILHISQFMLSGYMYLKPDWGWIAPRALCWAGGMYVCCTMKPPPSPPDSTYEQFPR